VKAVGRAVGGSVGCAAVGDGIGAGVSVGGWLVSATRFVGTVEFPFGPQATREPAAVTANQRSVSLRDIFFFIRFSPKSFSRRYLRHPFAAGDRTIEEEHWLILHIFTHW
jgi:hypothetical protein